MSHPAIGEELGLHRRIGHDEQLDELPLNIDPNIQHGREHIADVPVLEIALCALNLIIKQYREDLEDQNEGPEAQQMRKHGAVVSWRETG